MMICYSEITAWDTAYPYSIDSLIDHLVRLLWFQKFNILKDNTPLKYNVECIKFSRFQLITLFCQIQFYESIYEHEQIGMYTHYSCTDNMDSQL